DMLSAVKAALEPKTEKTPDSDKQGSNSEDPPAADAKKEGADEGEDTDDLTEEELARLRPKTRKRIDNLLKERADRDTKIGELEPKAQNFDAIQRFVDEAGLTKDEVNQGFDVMKSLKNDPPRAYAVLKPIMNQLEVMLGETLTPELQAQVDRGELTEGHARELARARSRAAVNGQMLERTTQQQQADQQRREFEGQVNDVAGAVTAWETATSKNDPDWKLKQPRIQVLVENEILRKQRANPNYFPSKEEALEMSKKALKEVETEFKRLSPQRRSISTPAADAGSTPSTAVPKTMLEAARAGLERARAG
ncbi:MAG: hypothetical protein ACXWK2_02985, partial [Rhizomicrobium sp.]